MKNSKIILNLFATLCGLFVLNACSNQSSKTAAPIKEEKLSDDCSTILESNLSARQLSQADEISDENNMAKSVSSAVSSAGAMQDKTMANAEKSKPVSTCKVMQVKIDQETACEISGSNKVDNLLNFYSSNAASDRTILIVPLNEIIDAKSLSFKSLISLYKIKVDIAKHLDSDLFSTLKDYKYKGIKCNISSGSFSAWMGEGKAIVSVEGQIIEKLTRASEEKTVKAVNEVKKEVKKDVKKVKKTVKKAKKKSAN